MSNMSNVLYPNVTSLPGQSGVGAERGTPRKPDGKPGEFDQALESALSITKQPTTSAPTDLQQIKSPLKFSAHASQRMQERKIQLDATTMARVNDAIDKAAAKGVEDTLVLTGNAALIVNVPNRTVVTALDKGAMNGNVFTNIDGAVIV
jgi:flagellar operon protein